MNKEDQKDYLFDAIQRLRFRHKWSKEELCRHLDINMADLHRYFTGQELPSESLLLIIQKELESGGHERRVKLRTNEIVDRLIDIDLRLERLERALGQYQSESASSPASPPPDKTPAE